MLHSEIIHCLIQVWRADFWAHLTACPLMHIVNFVQSLEYHVAANPRVCEPATAIIQLVLLPGHKSNPLPPAETARLELLLNSYRDQKKSLDNVVDVVVKRKLEVADETEITRWLESKQQCHQTEPPRGEGWEEPAAQPVTASVIQYHKIQFTKTKHERKILSNSQ